MSLPCCHSLRHHLLCRGALLHVMSLQLRCHPWRRRAVAVAVAWSCHRALRRCRPATRCTAMTAPPPVMSRGAATCRVVAVVLPPVGHHVVAVAVAWSCHGALLCVVSLSSCRSLHRCDRATACYVTGRCYVSCHRSCAAARGLPRGRGCCGVVMPRGAAVCHAAGRCCPSCCCNHTAVCLTTARWCSSYRHRICC